MNFSYFIQPFAEVDPASKVNYLLQAGGRLSRKPKLASFADSALDNLVDSVQVNIRPIQANPPIKRHLRWILVAEVRIVNKPAK